MNKEKRNAKRSANQKGMRTSLRLTRIFAASFVALSMGALWPATVTADEEAEQEQGEVVEQPRAARVSVDGTNVEIPRPSGWTIVAPPEGAVAVFRSTTDRSAQIEVRMSDGISQARWDRYVRTFGIGLQEAGFQVHASQRRVVYGSRRGVLEEYELSLNDEHFRLISWHTHEEDRAWVFSLFIREGRRDAHFRTFEEMLERVRWR